MDPSPRHAVFILPEGALGALGAAWLGWDAVAGRVPDRPGVEGLPRAAAAITKRARKYGFHGTLRAPFRLRPGADPAALDRVLARLADQTGPIRLTRGLDVAEIGGFLALCPVSPSPALDRLAAAVVAATDPLRAPLSAEERARRRPERLSDREVALLDRWGYPHVMEAFRFHLTLTGFLPEAERETAKAALQGLFGPHLRRPFVVDSLCHLTEGPDNRFHLARRHALKRPGE